MKILLYLENPEAKYIKLYWKFPFIKEIHYERKMYKKDCNIEYAKHYGPYHVTNYLDFYDYYFTQLIDPTNYVCYKERMEKKRKTKTT